MILNVQTFEEGDKIYVIIYYEFHTEVQVYDKKITKIQYFELYD
jgi:hypothetical protein